MIPRAPIAMIPRAPIQRWWRERAGRRAVMVTAAALAIAPCACKAEPAPAATPPSPAIDPAAVNALVPATLKDRLVFEARDLVIERGKHTAT
jgi:hypothetical protein